MIRGHERELVLRELLPEGVEHAGADRRAHLHARAEPRRVTGGIEMEIVDAHFARRPDALVAIARDEIIAGRMRDVDDMDMGAGHAAELEEMRRCGEFRGDRPARLVPFRRGAPRGLQRGDAGPHDFLVLVVEADGQPRLDRRLQDRQRLVGRQARKAHGMALDAGDLEGADAGPGEIRHMARALPRRHRRIEGDVAMRQRLDGLHLGLEPHQRVQRVRVVIGHVDHGRDAAGQRRAAGRGETRQATIAGRMRLAVDEAGKEQRVAEILGERRFGRRTASDRRDGLARDRDPAVLDQPVGADQRAAQDEIECHALHRLPVTE